MEASFLETYNETLRDLLATNSSNGDKTARLPNYSTWSTVKFKTKISFLNPLYADDH